MKPLKANEIFGTWATLLLPILPDQTVDFDLLDTEIDDLIASGMHGLYSNGTAGEFYNQTEKEFDQINERLADKCEKASLPFQVGCGHMDPVISMARVKKAKHWKPSAIQVILPDWCPPSQKEILLFLEKISEVAFPIGLVLYNPPHAKRQLLPGDYRVILEKGLPIVGCKVMGGGPEWFKEMEALPGKFSVFVPGHQLATGLTLGAHGSYSNMACLNPVMAQKWYTMMHDEPGEALNLEKRIISFFQQFILPYALRKGYSSAALDKFLSAVGGWIKIGTELKWPYKGIPVSEVEKIRDQAKRALPEFIVKEKRKCKKQFNHWSFASCCAAP
ncbi:MAG: dihydrodipicolinate synthase family protein [Cyclobacteriaceae bacterium]